MFRCICGFNTWRDDYTDYWRYRASQSVNLNRILKHDTIWARHSFLMQNALHRPSMIKVLMDLASLASWKSGRIDAPMLIQLLLLFRYLRDHQNFYDNNLGDIDILNHWIHIVSRYIHMYLYTIVSRIFIGSKHDLQNVTLIADFPTTVSVQTRIFDLEGKDENLKQIRVCKFYIWPIFASLSIFRRC